jgi:hypothetical protein
MTKRRHLLSTNILVLVGIAVTLAGGQTTPTVKQKSEASTCSDIVALTGNVNVNCSSLTPEQKKELEKIPGMLNKILANQLPVDEVMKKLDEIQKALARPVQTVGSPIGSISSQGAGSAISIGQQGGITAGTVNIGPPPLPTPTVKVCATYRESVGGDNYKSFVTFTTSSELPGPWFALFFDGPVLEGSVEKPTGSYGYISDRADKLPNPETTFIFRTTSINFGGASWFPSDGPIKATVPSQGPVKLARVIAGGGDKPDSVFNVNLDFTCDHSQAAK